MGFYSIDFKPSVDKDFARLPQSVVERTMAKIEALSTNPFPVDSKKLKDAQRLFRIRLGDYRIVYEVDTVQFQVLIHYVRHRKDVYRNL